MHKRFFEAKSFRFHVPKVIEVPKIQICMYSMYELHVFITCNTYMYVLHVCITCMYYMYVLHVCITCMYYMYVHVRPRPSTSVHVRPRPSRPSTSVPSKIKKMQNHKKNQKWKSSKTHHFRRFQPKRIAPLNSAYFFTYLAPIKTDFRHFFENDFLFCKQSSLNMPAGANKFKKMSPRRL